jgi:hypothetical protein
VSGPDHDDPYFAVADFCDHPVVTDSIVLEPPQFVAVQGCSQVARVIGGSDAPCEVQVLGVLAQADGSRGCGILGGAADLTGLSLHRM